VHTIETPSPDLSTHRAQPRFPLKPFDCKILTAILDKFEVFDGYGYPRKPLVNELADQIDMDPDDVYYSLKFLRMARFQ
jgi:hypothetical protein